jgi:flagellar protein FlaG
MLIEPVTESGKNISLTSQARLTTNHDTIQENDNTDKKAKTPSLVELSKIVADVQNNMNIIHDVDLQFSVNKDSGRIMVTVTDEATGKVIREIPPSDLVRFADKFGEMVGMIFDQKG